MVSLPTDRAFLVQLTAEASPALAALGGRVEHVSSGRSARFESREELWDFVARILAEATSGDDAFPPAQRPR